MKTVRMFKGMKGTCSRVSGTSPDVENGKQYKGTCITFPTVGMLKLNQL